MEALANLGGVGKLDKLPLRFGKRQGRFTRPPRPKENDSRELGEQATELLLGNLWIHPCNSLFEWKNCTVRVS